MLRAAPVLLVGALGVAAAAAAVPDGPRPDRAVVAVEADGCSAVSRHAAGWMAGSGTVVTVAHVVRGSREVRVDGVTARPVAIDLRTDVAVLAIDTALPNVGPLGVSVESRS